MVFVYPRRLRVASQSPLFNHALKNKIDVMHSCIYLCSLVEESRNTRVSFFEMKMKKKTTIISIRNPELEMFTKIILDDKNMILIKDKARVEGILSKYPNAKIIQ